MGLQTFENSYEAAVKHQTTSIQTVTKNLSLSCLPTYGHTHTIIRITTCNYTNAGWSCHTILHYRYLIPAFYFTQRYHVYISRLLGGF